MIGPGVRAAALALLVAASAFAEDGVRPLTIVTADGRRVFFEVEVADTPKERALGLMYRRELAANRGMVLWYPRAASVSIWMKNTYVPLDIVFIDESGTITRIHPDAVPLTETGIPSRGPARAVLEINAGLAERLAIAPGDRVVFPPYWPGPASRTE
jgi:uncharacterized membrane protein (UPF0127 family)